MTKLTTDDVDRARTLRRDHGVNTPALARMFGVSQSAVYKALVGMTWAGATTPPARKRLGYTPRGKRLLKPRTGGKVVPT